MIAAMAIPCCSGRTQDHQLLRIAHRQRAKQRLVQQREDRRIGSHAQRKREDSRNHEARSAADLAQREAEILYQRFHSVAFVSRFGRGE